MAGALGDGLCSGGVEARTIHCGFSVLLLMSALISFPLLWTSSVGLQKLPDFGCKTVVIAVFYTSLGGNTCSVHLHLTVLQYQ